MHSLPTPTNGLLYSYLNTSPAVSARLFAKDRKNETDVFSSAFADFVNKDSYEARQRVENIAPTPRDSIDGSETSNDPHNSFTIPPLPIWAEDGSFETPDFEPLTYPYTDTQLSPIQDGQQQICTSLEDVNYFGGLEALLPGTTLPGETGMELDDLETAHNDYVVDAKPQPAPAPPRKQNRPPRCRKKNTDPDTQARRRVRFLERNRVAADKCRRKKKTMIEGLEERYDALEERNAALRTVMKELVTGVEELRGMAALHFEGDEKAELAH